MNNPFALSYPVRTVHWDGRVISALPPETAAKQLDMLLGLGIREVMLAGYHEDESAAFPLEAECRKIGLMLRERGMKGAQHHAVAPSFASLGTSQDEVIRRLKRCVDYTEQLNADVLVFHTGKMLGFNPVFELRAAFERECAAHGSEAVRDTIAANLRIAAAYAQERGVLIALENIDGQEPLSSPESLPGLIRAVDHAALGFCLDTGHAHCVGNSILEWIDRLGDKLFTTHLHDNHGLLKEPGTHGDEHLPPGFGTISWRDVIRALHRAGYTRTLNFECGPWPGWSDGEGLAMAIRFWRTQEELAKTKELP